MVISNERVKLISGCFLGRAYSHSTVKFLMFQFSIDLHLHQHTFLRADICCPRGKLRAHYSVIAIMT